MSPPSRTEVREMTHSVLGLVAGTPVVFDPLSTPPPNSAVRHESRSLWDQLSESEKLACFGNPWQKPFNSYHRWDAKGRLRAEIWNKNALPTLESLVRNKYSKIFKSCGRQIAGSFHLALLGRTLDCQLAFPAVLICLNNRKACSRMKRLFEEHRRFHDLNTGLRVEISESWLTFPATDSPGDAIAVKDNLPDSLCGAPAFITRLSSVAEPRWKRTTLGGVIFDPDTSHYFGVTVAHSCDFTPKQGEGFDPESEDESTGSFSSSETSGNDSDAPEVEVKAGWVPGGPCGVYIDMDDQPQADTTPARQQPNDAMFIGQIDLWPQASAGSPEIGVSSAKYSLQLDWALINIERARFKRKNTIRTPWGTVLHPSSIQPNEHPPEGTAILAAGVSGVREVRICGTDSSLMFPWVKAAQKVWTLEADLAEGDSGSWVLSVDGTTLYGMVVAALPALSIVYLIRAQDLFEDITSSWPKKPELGKILPVKVLHEPEETGVVDVGGFDPTLTSSQESRDSGDPRERQSRKLYEAQPISLFAGHKNTNVSLSWSPSPPRSEKPAKPPGLDPDDLFVPLPPELPPRRREDEGTIGGIQYKKVKKPKDLHHYDLYDVNKHPVVISNDRHRHDTELDIRDDLLRRERRERREAEDRLDRERQRLHDAKRAAVREQSNKEQERRYRDIEKERRDRDRVRRDTGNREHSVIVRDPREVIILPNLPPTALARARHDFHHTPGRDKYEEQPRLGPRGITFENDVRERRVRKAQEEERDSGKGPATRNELDIVDKTINEAG
ncbi:hypothetical protein EDD36DRAFT_473223 [Exophiala viscosa]|uniref:Uncharacterized protein n=1 Tax=Exophiala viscosa TaxID=2486360 RepID=A0AAN6E2I1_9EURO|nr:hypothetical protein EDD36DRAFT_473223 [Exophiala viscosa]